MFKLFFVKSYASLLSALKNRRQAIRNIQKTLYFFRSLRLPLYKNIYDWLNFYSYYPVLERVLPLKARGVYFEWGPGFNTRLALSLMRRVSSVEHEKFWYEKYKQELPLIFSPISQNSCERYPYEIQQVGEKVDITFVDGRCRTECLESSAKAGADIVIMHDSLHPHTMQFANDGPPPVGHHTIYYYEGYGYFNFFVEIPDLRTIVLTKSEADMENCKRVLSEFFLRSGRTSDYRNL